MGKGKIVLIIVGVILLAVAGGVFYLLQNLDSIVKAGIEKYGSEAAGTAVRVKTVQIGLREGRGSLLGLTIANPPHYKQTSIFSLGEISLDLDTDSLTSEVPVIEEIRIGTTGFRYEVDAKGQANLKVLQANLKKAAGGGKPADKPAAAAKEDAPIRLKIKRLTIAGGEGVLDLSAVGGNEMKASLPGITLTDLGGKNGLTPQQLADAVLSALTKNLEKSAARMGVEKLLNEKLGAETGKLQQKVDEKLGAGAGDALKKMLGQ